MNFVQRIAAEKQELISASERITRQIDTDTLQIAMILAYEGHGQYAGMEIRWLISLIYDVDLDNPSLTELLHRKETMV